MVKEKLNKKNQSYLGRNRKFFRICDLVNDLMLVLQDRKHSALRRKLYKKFGSSSANEIVTICERNKLKLNMQSKVPLLRREIPVWFFGTLIKGDYKNLPGWFCAWDNLRPTISSNHVEVWSANLLHAVLLPDALSFELHSSVF